MSVKRPKIKSYADALAAYNNGVVIPNTFYVNRGERIFPGNRVNDRTAVEVIQMQEDGTILFAQQARFPTVKGDLVGTTNGVPEERSITPLLDISGGTMDLDVLNRKHCSYHLPIISWHPDDSFSIGADGICPVHIQQVIQETFTFNLVHPLRNDEALEQLNDMLPDGISTYVDDDLLCVSLTDKEGKSLSTGLLFGATLKATGRRTYEILKGHHFEWQLDPDKWGEIGSLLDDLTEYVTTMAPMINMKVEAGDEAPSEDVEAGLGNGYGMSVEQFLRAGLLKDRERWYAGAVLAKQSLEGAASDAGKVMELFKSEVLTILQPVKRAQIPFGKSPSTEYQEVGKLVEKTEADHAQDLLEAQLKRLDKTGRATK